MNVLNDTNVRGDEVDDLLRSFFHAEMPNPWPTMEVEERPVVLKMAPRPRTGAQLGRRIALAASVALLVVGSFFVLGRDSGYTPDAGVPGGPDTATMNDPMNPPDEFELREQLEQLPDGRTRLRLDLIPRRTDR